MRGNVLNCSICSTSALPKMSKFLKNYGHLSKVTAGNLLSFLILIIFFNLTKKRVLVSG